MFQHSETLDFTGIVVFFDWVFHKDFSKNKYEQAKLSLIDINTFINIIFFIIIICMLSIDIYSYL